MSTMSIKLVGGPGNGRILTVEKGIESTKFGFWEYGMAGKKDGDHQLFALLPRSRPRRRIVMWYIGEFGVHPGLAPRAMPFVKPFTIGRNDPCRCKSGKKYKRCCGGVS